MQIKLSVVVFDSATYTWLRNLRDGYALRNGIWQPVLRLRPETQRRINAQLP